MSAISTVRLPSGSIREVTTRRAAIASLTVVRNAAVISRRPTSLVSRTSSFATKSIRAWPGKWLFAASAQPWRRPAASTR